MKITDQGLALSPSDLVNHLGCNHLTQLNLAVAEGILEKPKYLDPNAAVLQERGIEFETAYLNSLRDLGLHITEPGEDNAEKGYERTLKDMRKGVDYIYQAILELDHWGGIADFLKRIDKPSALGNWSYEIIDTKLARETKAGALLQLCLYAQAIERIQGDLPEQMFIVTPDVEGFKKHPYRTLDFIAYHRLMQKRLQDQLTLKPELYPEPVDHCDICRWWKVCDKRRRDDDHLSLIAGISRSQRSEVESWGIDTMEALANLTLPLEHKPSRGMKVSYEKIREQARVQFESRKRGELLYEVLEQQPPFFDEAGKQIVTTGLYRLPEPTIGDIFLDFEGDPFVGTSGLEYLTGWVEIESGKPEYHHVWSFDAAEEKITLETFIDRVFQRLDQFPDLHIYHFGHYEPSALKRLVSRYATREREMDWLMRGKRFIDLHAIIRQTIRAGVEHYSLKNLEPLFSFSRKTELHDAARAKRNVEHALELNRLIDVDSDDHKITLHYNREDCISAYHLRNWLEDLRTDLIKNGVEIQRSEVIKGDESEKQEVRNEEIALLFEQLTADVPADVEARTEEQQARWILANLLEYHWRETKVKLWEKFRLEELPEDEMIDDKGALGGLEFKERLESELRHVVDVYHFPPQESELRNGDNVTNKQKTFKGSIVNIYADIGVVTLRKSIALKDEHPISIYSTDFINKDVLHQAIKRVAQWVAKNGIDGPGDYRALRDLLLCREPRPAYSIVSASTDQNNLASYWSGQLEESILPIQGPPGAGKTHTGVNIILDLVLQGKKVGVTALGHKVIENLLGGLIKEAEKRQISMHIGYKGKEKKADPNSPIRVYTDNKKPLEDLQHGQINILGGTPYMWSRSEYHNAVDVLIVDEAGQLSLADTIAAGQAAKSLVMLGDPQQLKQPQQGSHPEGTGVSALEHILNNHQTIPKEKGLFLDQTWRMHPSVCGYISELFYESKLHSYPGLETQLINGGSPFKGAGLWYVPVEHSGNQNSSKQEAIQVRDIVRELIKGDTTWTDIDNKTEPITLKDILIIAPYNAQVAAIKAELPDARVGTVDKFQGQEAPVVIYSMASSSPEDAPRGMDFLYNPNRLNVAISRARSAAIIVASPGLFSPDCRTPDQMNMANAFCRFLEFALIVK